MTRLGAHELWAVVGSMGQRELLELMVKLILFASPYEALGYLAKF